MTAYYNEIDPFAADWLAELMDAGEIAHGEIDRRDIRRIDPSDLTGYTQWHFFSGVAGWPLALRMAGWPDDRPVCTGSCPCQPFSAAGKRKGTNDERHLWPAFRDIIAELKPPIVFGEQVASSDVVGTQLEAAFLVAVQDGDFARANKLAKRLAQSKSFHYGPRWIDRVQADLAAEGYAVGFKVLGAHSVSANHIRQRVFWMAHAERNGRGQHEQERKPKRRDVDRGTRERSGGLALSHSLELQGQPPAGEQSIDEPDEGTVRLGHADGRQPPQSQEQSTRQEQQAAPGTGGVGGLGVPSGSGPQPGSRATETAGHRDTIEPAGFWSDFTTVQCADGKQRRVGTGIFPLAHGLPRSVGPMQSRISRVGHLAEARRSLRAAKANRVGRLKGYGNSVNPEVTAKFVRAYLETLS